MVDKTKLKKNEELNELKIKAFEIRNQIDLLENRKQQLILEYNKIIKKI